MIQLKTKDEIELMYESAQLVSKTLGMLAKEVKPGVTTLHLDKLAEEYIRDNGAIPGFLGLYDFPNTLVGTIDPEIDKMMRITRQSLYAGIKKCKVGNRIGDVSFAIQLICENAGYGVVRELVGHGLGKEMHEDPQVPNYGRKGSGPKIEEGLVIAIEPMINMGTYKVKFHNDGWTVTTKDNLPSCHFEHDVAVVDGEPKLLSTYKYIYEALGISSNEEEEFLYK